MFQIAELNIRHEQEKAQTLRAHQIDRDSSLKEHEQEKVSKVPLFTRLYMVRSR